MICTVLYLKKRVNVLYDPLSGMNRGFCLCPNNSEPQPVWDSCERTSLKVVFEAVIRMEDGCVFYPSVCVCVIWVTSSHLVLALWSQACFLFFSSFASQVAPTIWHRALKSRPSLSHQNGMKIYPHIPSRPVALSHVSRRLQAQRAALGWVEWSTEEFGGSMQKLGGIKICLKFLSCGRFDSNIKDRITELENVLSSSLKNLQPAGRSGKWACRWTSQAGERVGSNERTGSELHWLVWILNFQLPAVWRNSIDSFQLKASVICITYSPLSLPVASTSPSAPVYSARPGPCWIAPLLCRVDSPVCGLALIALVLCWVRPCAIYTP